MNFCFALLGHSFLEPSHHAMKKLPCGDVTMERNQQAAPTCWPWDRAILEEDPQSQQSYPSRHCVEQRQTVLPSLAQTIGL